MYILRETDRLDFDAAKLLEEFDRLEARFNAISLIADDHALARVVLAEKMKESESKRAKLREALKEISEMTFAGVKILEKKSVFRDWKDVARNALAEDAKSD